MNFAAKLSVFTIIFFIVGQGFSQNRFNAALMAGINLAQIDGDDHTGYHQLGANFGIQGTTYLTDRVRFNIELLFSQKGSQGNYNNNGSTPVFRTFDMKLNYVEVPILFTVMQKYISKKPRKNSFYRYSLSSGISYGRLLGIKIQESDLIAVNNPNKPQERLALLRDFDQDFNKTDISFVVGVSYYITKNIGLKFRHFWGVVPFFKEPDEPNKFAIQLRNYFATFQGFYEF